MRDGNDDKLFAFDRVDKTEGKASEQRPAKSVGDGNSKMWSLAN